MKVVAGRYAICAELGRGGMGVVWRADDQMIGRQVALKEVPVHADGMERVLSEVRTAGRLNDPAVVTVFDVVSENGVTYIVMELVEAPTLADVVAAEGPLSAARVAALGLQVLGALQAVHAAGVVHRDVKPSNIMVLPDGRVKLADFGIARAVDDPRLTSTGAVMGSPGYMAPELFSGSAPSPASDLWALGATLFHAAEGRSPFGRETTAATVHAIMYEEPQLTRCEGSLANVIMGMLARPVENRLTVAGAHELLNRPGNSAEVSRSVDQSHGRTDANHRNALLREQQWQEQFANKMPYSGQAPASWENANKREPEKKPVRKRALALAGAGALVVAVLLAAYLMIPAAERGGASPLSGMSTATPAAQETIASSAENSVTPSAPPSTVASAASAPPAAAVTAPKPGSGATNVGQAPPPVPPGQPDQQQPPSPPVPQRVLIPLFRYNHPSGPHFSATSGVPAPSGFIEEGPLGNLVRDAEPGTRKIYECQLNGSEDRMTSFDPNCEGHGNRLVGALGYLFSSKPAGLNSTPLNRCTYSGGHLDSVTANCEGQHFEFLFGYLIA